MLFRETSGHGVGLFIGKETNCSRIVKSSLKQKQMTSLSGEVLKDCPEDHLNSLTFKMVAEKTVFEYWSF